MMLSYDIFLVDGRFKKKQKSKPESPIEEDAVHPVSGHGVLNIRRKPVTGKKKKTHRTTIIHTSS
jgi:hypothetical protein